LVEIARALGAGARIIIMDEPTASLTGREVELLHGLVSELRSQGVGIIYISHRLGEVFQIADRVTVLRDGESVGTRNLRSRRGNEADLRKGADDRLVTSAATVTESELIRMMVGREVSTIFPPSENEPGECLLSVRDLNCRAAGIRDVSFEI